MYQLDQARFRFISLQVHLIPFNATLLVINAGNNELALLAPLYKALALLRLLAMCCLLLRVVHLMATQAASTEAFAHRRCRAIATRFKIRQGALTAILSLSIFVHIGPEPAFKVNVTFLCLSIGCAPYSECKEGQHRNDSEPFSPWSPAQKKAPLRAPHVKKFPISELLSF